jgi:long-chain acyl-CoA synthetase
MATVKQLTAVFFESAAKSPDAVALRFFDSSAGAWREHSWKEYERQVRKTAAWLQGQGIGKGDRVAIMSPNRPEWLIADLAILAIGAVSVPIYATASAKDVSYILEHSESKALLIDSPNRLKAVAGAPLPKLLVAFDGGAGATSLTSILTGDTPPLASVVPVDDKDIATIIYTSGTTGMPKGAVHTHGSFMATTKPVADVLNEGKTGLDRFFSFLPLSHVAERILVEVGSVITQSEVAFARSVDTLVDDMQVHPPTILLCVPRLWERIHEKIRKGLETASPVKKLVFGLAEKAGTARFADGGARILKANDAKPFAKIADKLVGDKLKAKLGMDKVRMFLTGSAPTRPDILRFFAGFGIFIREVYGLTENLCLGVYTRPDEIVIGSCGFVFPGGEVKIAADGEILLRAPWNFVGYYKNEQATKEAPTPDGWFMTGDLGTVGPDGRLRITGRKKELLKTSTGKYVAPVPLEDELKSLSLITDAMVVGDGEKYCVALVALDPTHPQASTCDSVLKEHLERLNTGKAHHEAIARLGVLRSGFSIEAGTLTPSLKLKRKAAETQYEGFIRRVYSANETVVRE